VIKLACALMIIILSILNAYTPGRLEYNDGYPYIAFIVSLSQTWAMYCLVIFYYQFKNELAPIHPVAKLACIKFVVFLTFWQGIAFAILAKFGLITETQ